MGHGPRVYVGMRVSHYIANGSVFFGHSVADVRTRIVEYATREQAQQAIQTLSNQSLMGRLVYVREVWTTRQPFYQSVLNATDHHDSN